MTGPVLAHAEIDIAADVRTVWAIVADIACWATWNPAVRHVRFDEELEVGARFRYSTSSGAMRCSVVEVDAPHRLAWTGRLMTIRQRDEWQVVATVDGTHVITDAKLSGLGAGLFRRRLGGRLQNELDAIVQLLKLEAELRVREGREEGASEASVDG